MSDKQIRVSSYPLDEIATIEGKTYHVLYDVMRGKYYVSQAEYPKLGECLEKCEMLLIKGNMQENADGGIILKDLEYSGL